MVSILGYIFLFIGLCIFVIMVLTSINILTKSYSPRHATLILGALILLFIVNSFLVAINYSKAVANFKDISIIPQNTSSSSSKESNGGKF